MQVKGRFYSLKQAMFEVHGTPVGVEGDLCLALGEPEIFDDQEDPVYVQVKFLKTNKIGMLPYDPKYIDLIEQDEMLKILYNS